MLTISLTNWIKRVTTTYLPLKTTYLPLKKANNNNIRHNNTIVSLKISKDGRSIMLNIIHPPYNTDKNI